MTEIDPHNLPELVAAPELPEPQAAHVLAQVPAGATPPVAAAAHGADPANGADDADDEDE